MQKRACEQITMLLLLLYATGCHFTGPLALRRNLSIVLPYVLVSAAAGVHGRLHEHILAYSCFIVHSPADIFCALSTFWQFYQIPAENTD